MQSRENIPADFATLAIRPRLISGRRELRSCTVRFRSLIQEWSPGSPFVRSEQTLPREPLQKSSSDRKRSCLAGEPVSGATPACYAASIGHASCGNCHVRLFPIGWCLDRSCCRAHMSSLRKNRISTGQWSRLRQDAGSLAALRRMLRSTLPDGGGEKQRDFSHSPMVKRCLTKNSARRRRP